MENEYSAEHEAEQPASQPEEDETWTVDQPMELHKLVSERHARKTQSETP